MESVAGMKWNHRPESRGIYGRNALEYAVKSGITRIDNEVSDHDAIWATIDLTIATA